MALGAVLVSAGIALAFGYNPVTHDRTTDASDAADRASNAARPVISPGPSTHPGGAPASPSASPSASVITVPATGPGTFRTAHTSGKVVGHGSRLRRYKVLVEDGIDISPETAAAEISAVLGDRRGWTRDGIHSFQLVGSGSYDFVVKIATPGTVDEVCGAAGLRTKGKVNCTVSTDVMVNLKRWVSGSPEFDGPVGEYRALIVNHEVGHFIGHGHETCPGPGRPAPAMMQQIKGLKGCVANAWPYDRKGHYISGPSVP
ncbi:DUF3152 domain-containing protein [Streptomyces sp. CGMCC 4.7035]|nr:DUF3152 domain-containing protein [Streptomyces sp. CGMCC 4.7035]WNC03331.1 DUF3152 domain-containing protein [Streptomyces sp. CGMCC 4.7035]